MSEIQKGAVIEVKFPFHVVTDYCMDEGGMGEIAGDRWKPGCRQEYDGPYGETSGEADGEGKMLLKVVDTFKPEGYPTRVFYTRQWQDPDGKVFGNVKLRMMTMGGFRVMCKGYRYQYGVV